MRARQAREFSRREESSCGNVICSLTTFGAESARFFYPSADTRCNGRWGPSDARGYFGETVKSTDITVSVGSDRVGRTQRNQKQIDPAHELLRELTEDPGGGRHGRGSTRGQANRSPRMAAKRRRGRGDSRSPR